LSARTHRPAAPATNGPAARNAAIAAGCPAGALTAGHVAGLDALVTGWRGQRWADLPGGVRGRREYGKLLLHSDNGEGAGGRD
jgi:tRNA(Ile)-lysidine synthase